MNDIRKKFSQPKHPWMRRKLKAIVGSSLVLFISLGSQLAMAADPFRSGDTARSIEAQTEAAFEAIFQDGHYHRASRLLEETSPTDPMAYAIQASLAYLSGDIETMGTKASETREVAEALIETDPLRGNLYTAVGHFMEGSYVFLNEGVRSTPTVLQKLRQVFSYLDAAEDIDPDDPELNLVRGYMDLMLAVNLPFSDPAQAIERLEIASPDYLSQRGLAIAYRDLDQHESAVAAIDAALEAAPNNPDLYYLKAQILVNRGDDEGSLEWFNKALEMEHQLPNALANQIAYEQCRAEDRISDEERNCQRVVREWRQQMSQEES